MVTYLCPGSVGHLVRKLVAACFEERRSGAFERRKERLNLAASIEISARDWVFIGGFARSSEAERGGTSTRDLSRSGDDEMFRGFAGGFVSVSSDLAGSNVKTRPIGAFN